MKKSLKVMGILACMILLVGSGAMAQVGLFQKTVTLDTTTIANVATPGSITESNGVYTITGNGSDIWNNGDEGFFAYNELSGSRSIQAKVKWISAKGDSNGGNSWGKIGVMVREKGDLPESKHYWIEMRCGDGNPALGDRTDAQWRETEGGTSGNVQIFNAAGTDVASADGVWLRVSRNAETDTFTSEYSMDGKTWVVAHTMKIDMQDVVSYGLVITSHVENASYMVTAEASDVSFGAGIFPKTVSLDTTLIANDAVDGSVTEANGVYTLVGNGSDIWNKGDEGFFMYKELSGPNSIAAKVKWISGIGKAMKASLCTKS